jgi:hypothetical protein
MAAFKAAVRGKLDAYMRADAQGLARVHTILVRSAGGRTKRGIQKQIDQNFDDAKAFKNTIRLVSSPPSGFSPKTTVRVYSKSRYQPSHGRRTDAIDLLEIYTRDETVTAQNKTWLAIPTENAPMRTGRGGQRKAQPSEAGVPLVFIKGRNDNEAFLVTKRAGNTRPILMYVLRRRTVRRARLNPDAVHRDTLQRMSAELQKIFAREDARMRRQFGAGFTFEVGGDDDA